MSVMRFFHTTSPEAARSIIENGWRGSTANYGFDVVVDDVVFLSAEWPATEQDGAVASGATLVIDLPLADVEPYEIVEEGKPASATREFMIPAAVLNGWGAMPRVCDEDLL